MNSPIFFSDFYLYFQLLTIYIKKKADLEDSILVYLHFIDIKRISLQQNLYIIGNQSFLTPFFVNNINRYVKISKSSK